MRRRALAIAFMTWFLWNGAASAGRLRPDLEVEINALPPGGMVSAIVEMTDQADPRGAVATLPARARRARAQAVLNALQGIAQRTQGPVLTLLAQEQAAGNVGRVAPLWIFNGLAVTATGPVIRSLAARPDVWEVRPDSLIPLPSPAPATAGPSGGPSEWNIDLIRAPEVWALDPTYAGVGTVVGSFDTGVDITHPDLAPRYRGNPAISWFDPYGEHATPYDPNGHGTHTTGTAVGGNAGGTDIGVAPGATWIAAKAWNDAGIGLTSAFHQIFQWFLAPGGDPANAPDVVNSSWGFNLSGCITEFVPDVQALRVTGIFPAFAAGNDGPTPGSVLSPGAYPESFATGATDIFDGVAFFSGRGPSPCDGSVKPDVSAPGDSILSSVPGGYAILSGTSMAAPHVTGAVAVLRSIKLDLTVEELESALTAGALDLGPAGPDDSYGAGRLDLFTSAQIVLNPNRPIVNIVATDPTATEAGLTTGTLTVTRTGSTDDSLTVKYTVGGTATPGSDYVALSGSVIIQADSATATITVTPIDDDIVEGDETVVITLSADPAYIVGAPGSATVIVTSDEVPPDLVVSALTVPATAGAGTQITVTDTTKNQGSGVAGPTTTRFYVSTNGTLDSGDVVLDGSRAVSALGAGATHSGSTLVTIPAGTAAGTYYLIAKADADNVMVETQEGNNTRSAVVQVGPDLVVSALTVPSLGGPGTQITVTDTTKNQGSGAAGPTTTRFYLSTNTILDSGDVVLDGSRAVPALGAGATHSGSTLVTIPGGTPSGLYYVIAKADADNAVAESQETNNTRSASIYIGPDLVISALTGPGAASAGTQITVTDTTKNQGGGAAGPTTTRFYLSINSTLDSGDIVLDGSRAVPALGAGATHLGSTLLTIPAGTVTGLYYLIAKADADNAVAESQETNNTRSASIYIGPDLVISALTGPGAASAGTQITVTDTTKNQGGGAVGPTTTRFYLSINSTLDSGDVVLDGSRAVPALGAGATHSGSTLVTIPGGTPSGLYYLIAKADADNAVAESQETNNTRSTAIYIGPDLVISALTVPGIAAAGTQITVTDTTKNQGGGAAGPTTTRFYLSTNSTLDSGDIVLDGSRAVPALGAGATHLGSTLVTIPGGTVTGLYYVIAKADADNAVAESQETNNTRSAAIYIGPDLVISALTVPGIAAAGTQITVTDTTKNQGGGAVGPTTTRFYLSINSTLDSGDVVLDGSRAVPALGAGATHLGSTPVTIPGGTVTGLYYLIAKADADNAVAESQETNNTRSAAIYIGPDLVISALTGPGAASAGTQITVTDTTKNQGGGGADPTTTRFYLSTNTILDSGDVVLDGSRAVPALGAGATHSGSTLVTIPGGTVTGLYYVIAKADADNAIAESQETNNTRSAAIYIGPDLVISALTVPGIAAAGAQITVTDTTKNQGGGAADPTTTRFYLSSNTTLDSGDVLFDGSRAVPALGAGATHSGSTLVTIPAGTAPGSYYLIAKADGDDVEGETQEGNNIRFSLIQISP